MKALILLLTATFLFSLRGLSEPEARNTLQVKDSIIGLWLMGQSLCEGSQSLPIVTPADTGRGNHAFKRGVRTWIYGKNSNEATKRPEDQFTFVPLTAATYGGLGETIANGLADHLTATLSTTEKQKRPGEKGAPFLVSYAGQGGRLIDELSEVDQSTDPRTPKSRQNGGGYYQTSLDDARRARKQAEPMDKNFSIAALVWMQGEANGGPTGGINPRRWGTELVRPLGQEWYRDRLIAYRKQWSHDLQSITGQAGEIPMFTYQTLGAAGEAQLMAANQDVNITMVGPHYMVASAINSRYAGRYGAAIHLSADGERWYGEQVAKVVRRVLVDKEEWQPLRPLKARIDSTRTSLVVDFQVPRPPLQIDDNFLPRQQYQRGEKFSSLYGFKIRDEAGAISMITAVEVASPTSIRIHLTSPVKAGTKLNISYGLPYAGQLGKITGIRKGPDINKQASTEILVTGDLMKRLKPLTDEGSFFAANTLAGDAYTQTPIRHVYLEAESTVLRFENRELRNEVNFVIGQALVALRPFSYGNLRDSDPEEAIYHFSDKAYGTRAGQSYPLWNWCVLFNKFTISEK